jgi:hypothetical protein
MRKRLRALDIEYDNNVITTGRRVRFNLSLKERSVGDYLIAQNKARWTENERGKKQRRENTPMKPANADCILVSSPNLNRLRPIYPAFPQQEN